MSVTIKDVATLAGVFPLAVSRTCKGHPSINRQTKEKVRQATAELGHELNLQASNLATQNSRAIGIILPPSEQEAYRNASYLEVTRGISQYCNQKQYINTVITGQNEKEILQMIKNMVRAGLAEEFIALHSREQDPVLDYPHEEGTLYASVGEAYRNVNQTIYVNNDNVLVGKETAEYFLELGRERTACLSGGHLLLSNNDRRMGCMLALTERGTGFLPELCVEVLSAPEKQNEVLHALLTRTDRPAAVLVSDDILAVALEKECMELGPSIPGDVSIISLNNFFFARPTVPFLTSVDVSSCQPGTQVVAQMIEYVESPKLVATKTIVPHHLAEWDSYVVYKRS